MMQYASEDVIMIWTKNIWPAFFFSLSEDAERVVSVCAAAARRNEPHKQKEKFRV